AGWSPQPLLQFHSPLRLLIAVLYDHRGVEGDAPFCPLPLFDGPRARDYDGTRRNLERTFLAAAVNLAIDQVINRSGAREYGSCPEYGTGSDQRTFIDSAVPAHQDVIFDDHRRGIYRLQHSADLRRCAQVHAFAHLGTRSHQGVRVDHRAFVDVGAHID